MLSLLVREVLAAERRMGPVFFRDMLGLHFSSTRPIEDELSEHPLAEFVIADLGRACNAALEHVAAPTSAVVADEAAGLGRVCAVGGTRLQ